MSIAGKILRSASSRESTSSILPAALNSSYITSSSLLPVSTSAVAIIVSEPPSSVLRAAPKNLRGSMSACGSSPPESILPEFVTELYARVRRVMLSSKITTSLPASTSRFACSSTRFAAWIW